MFAYTSRSQLIRADVLGTPRPTPMTPESSFNPIPPAYWDDVAKSWGNQVNERSGAYQFQYFEADLLISSILKPGMRVLEIGCGTGSSTLVHAEEVRRLIATDVSREMVKRARRRTVRRSIRHRVRFALADGGHLPFEEAAFDAVIGRGVALSYVQDPRQTLREIRRFLRPGGLIAIDAMNEVSSPTGRGFRIVGTIGEAPAYIEQFNEGSFQVRRVFYLRPKSPLGKFAGGSKTFQKRPPALGQQTLRAGEMHARYFPERTLRRIAGEAGLATVQIVPLGQMYRLLLGEDPETRNFVLRNRRTFSRADS